MARASSTVKRTASFFAAEIETVATGAVDGMPTTKGAVPLFPAAVAVMTAVPLPTDVMTPLGETVATAALDVDHATTTLLITCPRLS
jgi:hypothetical protein